MSKSLHIFTASSSYIVSVVRSCGQKSLFTIRATAPPPLEFRSLQNIIMFLFNPIVEGSSISVEFNLVSFKDIIPANLTRSSLIISCILILRFAMFKCNSGIPFNTVLKRGGGIFGYLLLHSLCISAAACSDTEICLRE